VTLGACCLPSGGCTTTTQRHCNQLGGTYQGNNTHCGAPGTPTGPCPAPQVGACCLPTGGCVVASQAHCTQVGGTYQGNGTNCGGGGLGGPCGPPPATGACCLPGTTPATGGCQVTTQAQCTQLGGTYQGNGTNCGSGGLGGPCGPPPVTGACCLPTGGGLAGGCQVTTQANCTLAGGTYQGDGTNCGTATNPTCTPPATGACCLPTSAGGIGGCQVMSQAQCTQLGGTYQGNGTNCGAIGSSGPCGPPPVLGACCLPASPLAIATCQLVTQA
jgi:hypothetical protein